MKNDIDATDTQVATVDNGVVSYQVVLNGKTLTLWQWDAGEGEVGGTLRTPQWVVVFVRVQ